MPYPEITWCPDGCKSYHGEHEEAHDFQEFRIHLGSRWSKNEGFVLGRDLMENGGREAGDV
jgi:hypothetical protein